MVWAVWACLGLVVGRCQRDIGSMAWAKVTRRSGQKLKLLGLRRSSCFGFCSAGQTLLEDEAGEARTTAPAPQATLSCLVCLRLMNRDVRLATGCGHVQIPCKPSFNRHAKIWARFRLDCGMHKLQKTAHASAEPVICHRHCLPDRLLH